jgi:predicted nucleic acid-binding protein
MIPAAVFQELAHPRAPIEVRNWANRIPNWIMVRAVEATDNPLLDVGEAEAIELAILERADFLVIDEVKGREIALAKVLRVTGTLGILEKASQRSLVEIGDAIEKLLATNFRADRDLIAELLKREKARKIGGSAS